METTTPMEPPVEGALAAAIVENFAQSVFVILSKDPKLVNARVSDNKTPIRLAYELGHLGIVKLLVRMGANTNEVVSDDGTPCIELPVADNIAQQKIQSYLKDYASFVRSVEAVSYESPHSLRRVRIWDEFVAGVAKKLASNSSTIATPPATRRIIAFLLDDLFLGLAREAILLSKQYHLEAGMISVRDIEYAMRLLVGSNVGHGGELIQWAINDGRLACHGIRSSGFGNASSSRITGWSWETGRDTKKLLPLGDVVRWFLDLMQHNITRQTIQGSVDPMAGIFISASFELICTELLKAAIKGLLPSAKVVTLTKSNVYAIVFEDTELRHLFYERYGKSRLKTVAPVETIIEEGTQDVSIVEERLRTVSVEIAKKSRATKWSQGSKDLLLQLLRRYGEPRFDELIRITHLFADYRSAKSEVTVLRADVLSGEELLFNKKNSTYTELQTNEVETGFDLTSICNHFFSVPSYVDAFGDAPEFSSSTKDLEILDNLLLVPASKTTTGQRAAAVARLLAALREKGTVVDFPLDDGGRTITMLAAQKGDRETAQFFTRKGANVNYYVSRRLAPFGSSARSAIAFAISTGQLEVVQSFLSSKGVDVDPSDTKLQLPSSTDGKGKERANEENDNNENEANEDEGDDDNDDDEGEEEGATPIDLSVRLNSSVGSAIIAELLSFGADVTSRFEERLGLVEFAAVNGNSNVIKLLLGFVVGTSAGGISQAKDDEVGNIAADLLEENKNACYLSSIAGFTKGLPDLLHIGFGITDHCWQVALTKAATEGDLVSVEYLYLFNKAKEDQKKRNFERTQKAATKSKAKAPALVKPNEVTSLQVSPALFYAAEAGHLEVLKLLVNFYKEIARKALNFPIGAREYTPLMVASLENHRTVVEWLCQSNGVEINQHNSQGVTALQCALYRNNENVIKVLLEAGADPR